MISIARALCSSPNTGLLLQKISYLIEVFFFFFGGREEGSDTRLLCIKDYGSNTTQNFNCELHSL